MDRHHPAARPHPALERLALGSAQDPRRRSSAAAPPRRASSSPSSLKRPGSSVTVDVEAILQRIPPGRDRLRCGGTPSSREKTSTFQPGIVAAATDRGGEQRDDRPAAEPHHSMLRAGLRQTQVTTGRAQAAPPEVPMHLDHPRRRRRPGIAAVQEHERAVTEEAAGDRTPSAGADDLDAVPTSAMVAGSRGRRRRDSPCRWGSVAPGAPVAPVAPGAPVAPTGPCGPLPARGPRAPRGPRFRWAAVTALADPNVARTRSTSPRFALTAAERTRPGCPARWPTRP